MTDYGDGPATYINLLEYELEWPNKKSRDIAWAYVAIAGDDFSEAVALVVADEEGKCVIRTIDLGRP